MSTTFSWNIANLEPTYHDDVDEDFPWFDCADSFKDLPDEDVDLIDSGSRVG